MATDVVEYTNLKSHESCRFDGVSLGEVMLRFHTGDVPTARAQDMRVFQGGGETNVACGLSYTFGLRTAVITALVDDDIGRNIINQLRAAGVSTDSIIMFNTRDDGSRFSTDQKGTLMNSINVTYNGSGVIPSSTCYYRAHSAVREIRVGDVDWEELFGVIGVRVFNTGGIYTLISPTSSELAIEAVQAAASHGSYVCADLNYRSKVEPDKSRARQINRMIAAYLGFLVGNDSDLDDALGYETATPSKPGFDAWLNVYRDTVRKLAADFPNLNLIGTQWRGARNADLIDWGAVLYEPRSDEFHVAPLREAVPIIDRTGGGDSFTSGVLAALLHGHDLQTAVEWGAAHGILVQEVPGDITMIDEPAVCSEVDRARQGGDVKALR